ncbi:MAG: hypothetical protein ABI639_02355 [Thermoanaerobaculia bacterium]
MKRSTIVGGSLFGMVALISLISLISLIIHNNVRPEVRHEVREESRDGVAPAPLVATPKASSPGEHPVESSGILFGRITTVDGGRYEGRLRWAGDDEAYWSHTFNGKKAENRWAAEVPAGRLPRVSTPIRIFGVQIAHREHLLDMDRLFFVHFGDIARIDALGIRVRLTLKSGMKVDLDRLEASDFDDGIRVWDGTRGVVDLDSSRIRVIEFLPTPALGDAEVPVRLYGSVRARAGKFTGFVQWNRQNGAGSDELVGRSDDGEVRPRFDSIRSIVRRSPATSLVTFRDGRETVLSGTRAVGEGNRGVYVDDDRYGRVSVSWDAFESIDFGAVAPSDTGPAYADFPPGRALSGSVTTRDGRHLAGRLVYDLDESETTETLDAPAHGVDFSIPFGRIVSIALPDPDDHSDLHAMVTLDSGEALQLELGGDLGPKNGGLLIFADGASSPEYLAWSEIRRIDFDRSPDSGGMRGAPSPSMSK